MAIKPGRPKKKTAGKRKYRKVGGYDFTVLFREIYVFQEASYLR